jgi:hypothetical protein
MTYGVLIIIFFDTDLTPGKLINEGKTKEIFDLPKLPGCVLVQSKDRITAGQGTELVNMIWKVKQPFPPPPPVKS